jgi:hypothetical protein
MCDINLVLTLRQLETANSEPTYARTPDVIGNLANGIRLLSLDQEHLGGTSLSGHDFKLSTASACMLREPHILCDPTNKLPLNSSALRLVTPRCRA